MTQAEYLQLCARLEANKAKRDPDDAGERAAGVEHEADLHEAIMSSCRSRGWLVFHGSMAHRTHRSLGEPDLFVIADHGRFFMVECKSKTGKLTIEQQGVVLWAAKLGHTVHVIRSLAEFEKIVTEQPSAESCSSPPGEPGAPTSQTAPSCPPQ